MLGYFERAHERSRRVKTKQKMLFGARVMIF